MSIQKLSKAIVQKLVDNGHTAYYAGGYVRDMLLGLPSADIDIATSATPEEVMALFEKTVPVGVEFGSVIVVEGDHPFEVTTFRSEGEYLDGRRPSSVHLASAEEDAKRRSITINGMFYDPLTEEVIDFVHGREDLQAGIIRAIGDPFERFEEDKLRMIRAIRFATRFGFTIEEKTQKAIRAHAHELFPAVAIERVWQEFQKMSGPEFLIELQNYGLLQQIFPQLTGVDIAKRLENYTEGAPTIGNVMLLFDEGQEQVCDRLKVSNRDRQFVALLEQAKQLLKGAEPYDWAHFYAHDEAVFCLRLLGEDDHGKRRDQLAEHIERIRTKHPIVTSQDLLAHGVEPGPRMGELLRKAERISINENLVSKEQILNKLRLM